MGKGRDKQGREPKKKKKSKQPAGADIPSNVQFRHHSVVTEQPPAPRTTE